MPRRKKSTVPQKSTAIFITRFFAQFPDFDYDPTAPVNKEYYRLRDSLYQKHQRDEKKALKGLFGRAMGKQFASFYGSSIHDIRAWQALCAALDVNPVPGSIKECKEIIESTHVNLVDFIDTRITGERVKIFDTEEELREYTVEHAKYYLIESAKESGVLKYLLRRILSAPLTRPRSGRT